MVAAGFEPDEWDLLLLAPWTVAMGVVQADPSSGSGRKRELDALMDRIRITQAGEEPSELVRSVALELVGGPSGPASHRVVDSDGPGDLRQQVLNRCGALADLLERRVAQSEADAFKRWLLMLAETVAEAAREGGVLGIGGARVSSDERAMLQALAEALRIGP